jgi:hypothetical protein
MSDFRRDADDIVVLWVITRRRVVIVCSHPAPKAALGHTVTGSLTDIRAATFRVSPLPLHRAVLILYSSNLFIYIFNFYCSFICILFISLYPYISPLTVTPFHICCQLSQLFALSVPPAALRCLYPPLSHPIGCHHAY